MGYTHYFTFKKPLQQKEFDAIKADVKVIEKSVNGTICETAGASYPEDVVLLRDGLGEGDGVLYENNGVFFNGEKELGHETMGFRVDDSGYSFCKTNRKPYDVAVCLTLLAMKHHLGEDIEITSDGGKEDWMPALRLYKTIFKRIPSRQAFQ